MSTIFGYIFSCGFYRKICRFVLIFYKIDNNKNRYFIFEIKKSNILQKLLNFVEKAVIL